MVSIFWGADSNLVFRLITAIQTGVVQISARAHVVLVFKQNWGKSVGKESGCNEVFTHTMMMFKE